MCIIWDTGQYKYSGNIVPEENGAYLTNETGEIRGNPRTFPLKASDERNKLIKTTLMLPQETHKWLKSYGDERGISLGDTIRRVVADFQAGTVRFEQDKQRNINTAGAATYTDNQKDK